MSATLFLLALCFTVSSMICISEADYNFTIRFFEFRNPLGLQCGKCGNGGPPACCDDVQRLENCNMTKPFNCDTRFRFMLRPFGASVETAPNTGFDLFTRSNGLTNTLRFNEGPGRLLGLPNPFTITRTEEWTGRIQFFIDAIDRDNPMSTSGISETLAIIDRYPIDLELNPGPNFTERTTYTGIYNISDVGFVMSFRVQCLENYFGPNCTTFCEPLEGVYLTCDSEGRSVCLHNRDPTTNCMTCLQGWDLNNNCTQCVTGRDITTNCTTCLTGYDPSTNCTQCLPGVQCQTIQQPSLPTQGGFNLGVVGGALGGAIAVTIFICIVLGVIIILMKKKLKSSGVEENCESSDLTSSQKPSSEEKTLTLESVEGAAQFHDFDNPLYDEAKAPLASEDVDNRVYTSPQGGEGNRDDLKSSTQPPSQEKAHTLECEAGSHDFDNPIYDEAQNPQTTADVGKEKHTTAGPDTDFEAKNSGTTSHDGAKQADNQEAPDLYATVDVVTHGATEAATTVTGMEQNNEYDELCTSSPAGLAAASTASNPPPPGDSFIYSEVSESPREGEVYNVAYPVNTFNRENLNEAVGGYECLSTK